MNWKSLIFKEEGNDNKSTPQPDMNQVMDQSVHLEDPEVEQTTEQDSSVEGVYKKDLADIISSALQEGLEYKSDKPFNYLKFKESLTNMGNIPFETKLNAISATLKTFDIDLQDIEQDGLDALTIISNAKQEFFAASDAAYEEKVGSVKSEIQQLEEQVKQKNEEIMKLQDQVLELTENIQKNQYKSEEEERKIRITKSNFEVTYEKIEQSIKDDLKKIKDYLGDESSMEG